MNETEDEPYVPAVTNKEELAARIREWTNGAFGTEDGHIQWFIACLEADSILGNFTTRDMAQALIDGDLVCPTVEDWLQSLGEGGPGSGPSERDLQDALAFVYGQRYAR